MQASWWERLVPAHSYVELGLVYLVSRDMLHKTLGNLSADWWGCGLNTLIGLSHPSTEDYSLLVGGMSLGGNSGLQENSG